MADNPGGKVAPPALATTANMAKQPRKRKTDSLSRSSKRERDKKQNKHKPGEGAELESFLAKESHATASYFLNIAYLSFN